MSARSPMPPLPAPARQRADDAGAAEPAMHVEAEAGQAGRQALAGAHFVKPELGMHVEIAPPSSHLVVKGRDFWNDGYCRTPLRSEGDTLGYAAAAQASIARPRWQRQAAPA
jgi:hypothetical protein